MNTNSVDFFQTEPFLSPPPECELSLAVWKIKNPQNMGNIIRMGHNLGAKQVLFVSELNNKREHRIAKTARLSFEQQPWKYISPEDFLELANKESELFILETCPGATNIYETKFPKKIIILGGNESFGLPEEIIKRNNTKIYIPMPGGNKSLNISHALTVVAFEWYRQNTLK